MTVDQPTTALDGPSDATAELQDVRESTVMATITGVSLPLRQWAQIFRGLDSEAQVLLGPARFKELTDAAQAGVNPGEYGRAVAKAFVALGGYLGVPAAPKGGSSVTFFRTVREAARARGFSVSPKFLFGAAL